MKLRGYETSDAKEVVRLHRKFNKWFEKLPVDEEFINNASLRADFKIFIAEEKGEVAGFSGVLFQEHVGRAELGPICVDPIFQKKGVGSNLVEHAIKFLREKNIHRIIVKVKAGNVGAEEFFKSRGFEVEAKLKKYTKALEEVVQMVRIEDL
ncbi:MAG: GNAT family N-acetyltransferase [Methanobacteriota archaeon]